MSDKKIKILFLIDRLWLGGSENQLMLLAEGLPPDGFQVSIGVLFADEQLNSFKSRVPIINFNWAKFPILNSIIRVLRLRRYIKNEKIDIIQAYFPDSIIRSSLAILFLENKPYLISTRRNLYHWIDDEPWTFKLMKWCNRWTDMILVNSYTVLKKCHEIEHVPQDHIKMIPNGVLIDKFRRVSPEQAKQNLGLNANFPVIGSVANWRPVKGLVSLIKAAALVVVKFPSARIVLIGFGPQKDELLALRTKLGLDDQVVFLERRQNVHELIPAFDVAVLPSLSESFSNVLLEYMAAGKPIVATGVGDAAIIIENMKHGLIVKPDAAEEMAAAIISLCMDRVQSQQMGKNAQEKAISNYSAERIIRQHIELYEKIIENAAEQYSG